MRSFFLFIIILCLLQISCTRDEPDCLDASCYIGFYSANDFCVSGNFVYDAVITPSAANDNEVFIDRFAGYEFASITATIENNIISFGPTLVNGGLSLVEGAGTLSNKGRRINWNYTILEVGYYDNCTGIWDR